MTAPAEGFTRVWDNAGHYDGHRKTTIPGTWHAYDVPADWLALVQRMNGYAATSLCGKREDRLAASTVTRSRHPFDFTRLAKSWRRVCAPCAAAVGVERPIIEPPQKRTFVSVADALDRGSKAQRRVEAAIAVIDKSLSKLNPGQGYSVPRRRAVKRWAAVHLLTVRSALTDEPYTGERPWES